jgi:hypothetical protein
VSRALVRISGIMGVGWEISVHGTLWLYERDSSPRDDHVFPSPKPYPGGHRFKLEAVVTRAG